MFENINGTRNYYIEAQARDARRMDVVVDYLQKKRYLLNYNFNKKKKSV